MKYGNINGDLYYNQKKKVGTSTDTYFTNGSFGNIDTTNLIWELPSAGTYILFATLRIKHTGTTAAYGVIRLYNNTISSAINETDRMAGEIAGNVGVMFNFNAAFQWIVTVTEASTIYL